MESPVLIDIGLLKPHPQNPRVVEREDVIASIEQQIRAFGFEASHAILARPMPDGTYQILGGHNRTKAAQRAGLAQVPTWVREMSDEEAFMQLLLCNTQGELSALEKGLHALEATEKGKWGKSISAYAKQIRTAQQTVSDEVCAARVAQRYRLGGDFAGLVDKAKHLAEIHVAPESCWPFLVKRLVTDGWSREQTKAEVHVVNTAKAPRGYADFFPLPSIQEAIARGEDVNAAIRDSIRAIERGRGDLREGQYDADKFIEVFDHWIGEHGAWNAQETSATAHSLLRAQRDQRREAEAKASKLKRPIVLAEWNALSVSDRQIALAVRNDKARLTKQDKDSAIDWARYSWNPVTGCRHGCPYCYARDIAERFYTQKFEPAIVPDALAAPLNMAPPKEAAADAGYKNIFTCSMADLFGAWVPAEWINAVLDVAREATQWNFLMLTKFPQRVAEFALPENVWMGTTVDCQARAANAQRAMAKVGASVRWLSIEPLLEPGVYPFFLALIPSNRPLVEIARAWHSLGSASNPVAGFAVD